MFVVTRLENLLFATALLGAGCTGTVGSRPSETDGAAAGDMDGSADGSAGEARDGAPPDAGPDEPSDGLEVLLLTDDEGPDPTSWETFLRDGEFRVTIRDELAYTSPSSDQLDDLAEEFDVAIVGHDVDPVAYEAPAWNHLPMGLVTTNTALTGGNRWHWLDTGPFDPAEEERGVLAVRETHSALYGLTIGEHASLSIEADGAGTTPRVSGVLREAHGTTDRGTVALSFDASADLAQQLVLWEPGPFFSSGDETAAGRRALFGLASPPADLFAALSEDGRDALIQTVHWAAMPGQPLRPDSAYEPDTVFLTWQDDPTTTMTIDWHVSSDDTRGPELRYWPERNTDPTPVTGATRPFPSGDRDIIHRVELTGLSPDTLYAFDFGEDSRVYRFRTLPETLDRPLTFVVGGDLSVGEQPSRTARVAGRYSPAFAAFGGDLAYVNGGTENANADRWHRWFDDLEGLHSADGRVVPVLVAAGNHEVMDGYYDNHAGYEQTDEGREQMAPNFYGLFAFPGQPGYAVLDAGDYMSWVILDTDHSNPIEGAQTEWLADVLEERGDVPHVFPLYHYPGFAISGSYFGGPPARRVRTHFVPLFEAGPVRTAFENHVHVYKRTQPIRDMEVASDGIVYLGDGAWGRGLRSAASPDARWFGAESVSITHFILGTIDGHDQHFQAIDQDGNVFDSVSR